VSRNLSLDSLLGQEAGSFGWFFEFSQSWLGFVSARESLGVLGGPPAQRLAMLTPLIMAFLRLLKQVKWVLDYYSCREG